jgi:osmotically-inducible protein OsmY
MNQTLTLERTSPAKPPSPLNPAEVRNRLTQLSQQRLATNHNAEVRRVQCEIHEGILFLRGHVSSYFSKQLAQESVRSVKGLCGIANFIEVKDLGTE